MIAKQHRFHGMTSLRFVFGRGQVVRGPYFSLRAVVNNRQKSFRVAVVVSKKVHKSAVARNRIRRRIYETIRTHQPEINQAFDIVVSVHTVIPETLTPKQLDNLIVKQFKKSGIL